MIQKKTLWLACATAMALSAGGSPHADSFTEALTGGKVKADVRVRYEHAEQDNALDDADGVTIRTRLGYNTGKFNGIDAFVEMENNTALLEDYNSGPGGNAKSRYSVIADPDNTEVHRAYLGYDGIPGTNAKLGRQEIILDNARFVGNVVWRQLGQSYDAARVTNKTLPGVTINYAYIDNVKNIFSADIAMSDHLINVAYDGVDFAKIAGYGYFLAFNGGAGVRANSTQTLGAYIDGSYAFDAFKLLYRAEYAKQSDYEDGNSNIDADYQHFVVGASAKGITGKVGYELLGGDNFGGFETPLATKHAFNGWADIFLNTPADGLEDTYFLLTGKLMGVKLLGVYHDYQSDKSSLDYGTEINLLAAKKFGRNYTAGIKYANYDADDYKVDTEKLWVWGQVKF